MSTQKKLRSVPSFVTPTGYGFSGCVPPTNEDRLRAYARALGDHYDAQDHARRAADGLAILPCLRKIWKRLEALKRRAMRNPKVAKPKQSNVVPLRKRA